MQREEIVARSLEVMNSTKTHVCRKWRDLAMQLLHATSRSVGGAAKIGIGFMRLAENLGNFVDLAVCGGRGIAKKL